MIPAKIYGRVVTIICYIYLNKYKICINVQYIINISVHLEEKSCFLVHKNNSIGFKIHSLLAWLYILVHIVILIETEFAN